VRFSTLLAAGLIASSPAVALDRRVDHWVGVCSGSDYCNDFRRDWPAALQGDVEAIKNMTFYFYEAGRGTRTSDPDFACAWQIVLIMSGDPEVDAHENFNLRSYCGRPKVQSLDRPRALAAELFREIFKKSLPPPPWGVKTPVEEISLPRSKEDFARMTISAQALVDGCPGARLDGDRVNAIARRMGLSGADLNPGKPLREVAGIHAARLKVLDTMAPGDAGSRCRSLDDSYGLRGLTLQGIADVPAGPDYPN